MNVNVKIIAYCTGGTFCEFEDLRSGREMTMMTSVSDVLLFVPNLIGEVMRCPHRYLICSDRGVMCDAFNQLGSVDKKSETSTVMNSFNLP